MHQTVLLREAVDALVTAPSGAYVDGTFGRGGHSRFLLDQLDDNGHLLVWTKTLLPVNARPSFRPLTVALVFTMVPLPISRSSCN